MNQDQLESARRVAYLITGFIRNDLTNAERTELDEWIAVSDDNMKLFGKLTDKKNILEAKEWFDSLDMEMALKKFTTSVQQSEKFSRRRIHPAWMAAASIIIILVIGITLFRKAPVTISRHEQLTDSAALIIPGSKKAILVDGNGKQFDLSQPGNALIRIDDKNQARNVNSVLNYIQGAGSAVVHTLRTPRGGEYQVILPDGTHVWLNAESAITYPTAFDSAVRKVELTGEAYFEVQPDRKKLFYVFVNNDTKVEVLGTHFNINAYPSSLVQKISLLEGSIKVELKQQIKKMIAGQQAVVIKDSRLPTSDSRLTVINNANVEITTAWTRGRFSFDKTPVSEVLQQLGRWYDVTVDYQENNRQEFTGEIFRNSSLDEVLRMMKLSTGENFTIHGKTIVVRP